MNDGSIQTEPQAPPAPSLRRVLSLSDLMIYAIVIVQPIAPLPLFGITQADSRGHAVLTLLGCMVAMMFTAVSYGRMAALYPCAGSAYTYVERGLNPRLGFLAGWAMLLCYLMFPLINVIYVSVTVHRVFPFIPYVAVAAACAAAMTFLNLRGIRSTASANRLLFALMILVIGAFVALAIRYLLHASGGQGTWPGRAIYNPQDFDWHSVRAAAAFAILTYLGFDGVTTLAEDAEHPHRDVPLATVFVVIFTGILGALLAYLGARVWPDYRAFPNLETAFMDVCRRVGGAPLYHAMAAIFVVASFGTGLAAQVGAARLLFGMGRDDVLPRKIFARLDPASNAPAFNIAIIGIVGFAGALGFNFEHGTDLLNFGAFIAFMGVNAATFWHFYIRGHAGRKRQWLADAVVPLLGFLSCLAIWLGLPRQSMIVGGSFLLLGLAVAAIQTRGFRSRPVVVDL